MTNHPDVRPGEVLVLSTRRLIGYAIRDGLIALGRAATSFFTEQSLDKLIAKEGFTLLTLLVRPDDMTALRAWLGIDHTSARTRAYKRIWQNAQAAGISPRQLLDRIVAGTAQAPPHTADLITRYRNLLASIAPLTGLSGPALIDILWPPANPDCADVRAIALAIASTVQAPADMLDELVAAIIQPELPGDQNDVIRVMSLHKSKGLTAKCVVVAGCVAGALPTFKSGLSSMERQQALEEQRRLFYVAITRTTQTLVLSGAPTVSYGEAMRMGLTVSRTRQGLAVLQASPYWSELGPQAPNPISGQGWRSALGF